MPKLPGSHRAAPAPKLRAVARLPGARGGPPPRRLEAQLATLVSSPPDGGDWLHEIKFDGYRIVAIVQNGKARLFSRRGNDWSERFAAAARAATTLRVDAAVLDGEVAVLRSDGT